MCQIGAGGMATNYFTGAALSEETVPITWTDAGTRRFISRGDNSKITDYKEFGGSAKRVGAQLRSFVAAKAMP